MDLRIHSYEGVANFRDFGDYASRYGGRAAARRLFRSAHHGGATDADLARMAELGLAAVVDLRRISERRAQPSRRWADFAAEVIECDIGDVGEAPHIAFLRRTDLSPASVRAFYLDYYAKAPFEPRHRDLFRRYFEALARAPGGVLIHCTAGKDRTGLLAALTHHVLGVEEAAIVADYMLTNAAVGMEARLPTVALSLEQTLGRKPTEAAVRAFLGVEADFLTAALEAIRAGHGTVEGYLESLGVDASMQDAVRANLLG
jgi:protein-tyrosine phosphatase